MKPLGVGDQIPEFSLPDQEGNEVNSRDILGQKALVLFFYPADNSPVCTKEACSFRDAYQDFLDAGATVIGVSSDSVTSHKKFASNHRLPFPLLSDSDQALRKAFGVPKSLGLLPGRTTYVIDKQGKVRHFFSSQFSAQRHVDEALGVVRKITTEPEPL